MGIIKIKKSNKKHYIYVSFSEFLKKKSNQKKLICVLLLLFVVIFSFFPIWLFQKAGNVIKGTFEWEDTPNSVYPTIWIDEPVVDYKVELWRDGSLYATEYTDINGLVQFLAPDMTSSYEMRIFKGTAYENYVIVDADVDGQFDMVFAELSHYYNVVEFRFDISNELYILQDVDLFVWNEETTTWDFCYTLTTDEKATTGLQLIGGFTYSVYPSMYNFSIDTTTLLSICIPDVLYVEPIVMLISSIIIMYLIIWKRKSQIFLTNKSVRNLKNRYNNSEIRNCDNQK